VNAPNDWNYKAMFAADGGVIYGVQGPDEKVNGRLFWYRHLGRGDGSDCWAKPGSGLGAHSVQVGGAWNYDQMFAADDDAVYGVYVSDPNALYWYRHLGHSAGKGMWAHGGNRIQVGKQIQWKAYKQVFSADDGVIYAIAKS
jgi:hypothetical protein